MTGLKIYIPVKGEDEQVQAPLGPSHQDQKQGYVPPPPPPTNNHPTHQKKFTTWLSNMLTYFFVTSGYGQSHSNSHLLNARFVNVIQKVHLLNCVAIDGNREYSVSLKTARMREDNGR